MCACLGEAACEVHWLIYACWYGFTCITSMQASLLEHIHAGDMLAGLTACLLC